MPRASRHFLPNRVWYITHPCHKWVDAARGASRREPCWSATLAVGSEAFGHQDRVGDQWPLSGRAAGRWSRWVPLRERAVAYRPRSGHEMGAL